MNLLKNFSTFYLLTSTFNHLTSAGQGFFYWHYDDKGIWSDSGLFDGMRLVIIALTINLTFIDLINFWGNFTSLINYTLGSLALLSKLTINSYRSDFHRSNLSLRQFTLLMNYTLSSTIYLGPNADIIAGSSNNKSRFICYFRIAALSRNIVLQ